MVALALAVAATVASGEITIRSSRDGAEQRAILAVPKKAAWPAPLLVHLHSWSADYKSSGAMEEALREAEQRGWIFLSPDFRGPNDRPEACASDLAVADIVDAVRYAASVARVDPARVYLLGGSGGGHMALMMAARHPELWAAVSAWVPITDLAAWHESTKARGLRYAKMIESCCGGPPGTALTDAEYRKRSPLHELHRAKGLPLAIDVGIYDGHEGSVPVSHSLRGFNELAKANGHPERAFSEHEIEFITGQARLPDSLARIPADADASRKNKVLHRREAGAAVITIFDGGHETDFPTAIRWLAGRRKKERP